MNSVIYIGKIYHTRIDPKKNDFTYPIYMMYLDLDELEEMEKNLKFFSLNRFNIFGFFDKDHFTFLDQVKKDKQLIAQENVKYKVNDYKNKNTKARIIQLIKDAGMDFEPGKIFALTNLRIFGYVFNPVTFYYCFDKDGIFKVLVSEVNNTFGDQKMYYVKIDNSDEKFFTSLQRKNFYISPYTKHDNDLAWKFSLPDEKVFIVIDSLKKGCVEVKATFTAKRHELTDKCLLFLTLRYPLYTLMVIFRIYYQALKLYFKKVRFNKIEDADKEIAQKLTQK